MIIGVLGSGMVGQALATRCHELGHTVTMGSRSASNERAVAWAGERGERARADTFTDAAGDADLVINATNGVSSLAALATAADQLRGKTLMDVANPLDFSHADCTGNKAPSLSVVNTDSLAEQIQRAHPEAQVVKALNTMNNAVMVHPESVPGEHDVFVCGDHAQAKSQVAGLLRQFGWPERSIIDLGGLDAARGTEMYLPLWLKLVGLLGQTPFNIHVAH